ncbi:MAG: ArgE/DapE family deacylase [Candidatus Aminicenantes bacterium]|jgi:acetylornithine deacetylase
MNVTIDREFLTGMLQKLVQIDSVNPGLVPGSPGELAIGAYIADVLRTIGLEPQIHEIEPGRVNVVAMLKGSGEGRSLMFNGHMDTVGVEGMDEPFSGKIRDGRVYGRGAQDMKGSIAGMMAACKALIDADIRLKGDIVFAAVADEEYRSIGTEALVETVQTDAAIVAEPTGLDVCLAHRGFGLFEFETRGRTAHGSRYQNGIDANIHMGRILMELDKLSQRLLKKPGHPLLGTPSLHVPVVKGGSEPFIYSDRCKISVERRTLPGESWEDIHKEMVSILSRLSSKDRNFQATVRTVLHRDAYEISPDAEIVKLVSEKAKEVRNRKPDHIGHDWWEDSALLAERGIETVIFGPKGEGIHSHEEWVDIQSVVDLAEILARIAIQYCN